MPNWVYNTLSVEKEYADKLKEISEKGVCRYYKPMPEEYLESHSTSDDKDAHKDYLTKKYGFDDWYGWCNYNWGTKWGCCVDDVHNAVIHGKSQSIYYFDTAWSPFNQDIIEMFAKDIPDFIWKYVEEQGWGAELTFVNGECVHYRDWDIPVCDTDEFNEAWEKGKYTDRHWWTIVRVPFNQHYENGVLEKGYYADYEWENPMKHDDGSPITNFKDACKYMEDWFNKNK